MTTEQSQAVETKPVAKKSWLRILGYICLAGLILVGGVAAYATTLPDDFRYQRSAVINAPADAVFPLINNFHEWGQWSPWEKLDPKMKRSFAGPESGPGAIYSWAGDANIGEGQMTILESKPDELISIKLEFIKPFAGVCPTTFKLEPSASGTKVTWTMEGKNSFMPKVMSLFMDMEKMVCTSFDEGLATMNTVAQAKAAAKGESKSGTKEVDTPNMEVPEKAE